MGGRASESVVTTAMSGHVASNDIRAEHVARTGGEDAVEAGRRARRSTSAKVASPPSPEHCDPSDAPCATSTVTSTSSAEPAAEARVRSGQVPLGHKIASDQRFCSRSSSSRTRALTTPVSRRRPRALPRRPATPPDMPGGFKGLRASAPPDRRSGRGSSPPALHRDCRPIRRPGLAIGTL
jgi:hypothetical protein